MTARTAAVVGGGLAGITAAIALADAGVSVTLTEARPRLGGAAASYSRGGLMIDNGQHVFLRCCGAYRELLARLGVTAQVAIQDRFDVTVLAAGGQARLRRTALPGPLHMGLALARYRPLSLTERLRVPRAALALRFADLTSHAADSQRLGDWLAARGQTERARRRLWDLFIVSALNVAGDDASVPLAATVIKTALLGARDAADIGMAMIPLGELHGEPAATALAGLGAQVRLGAKASAVRRLPDGRFGVWLARGSAADEAQEPGGADAAGSPDGPAAVTADGVVLAVPPGQAARLAGGAGHGDASRWDALGHSPIVNVHVIYDRQVTALPFAAAVDSPVQWVFDKTRQAGLQAGQYLAVSLSAAEDYVDVPSARLRAAFLPELERLFPAAAAAAVTDFFVTRERRATFRQVPGCSALRPGTATPVPGFMLAGAWTDTGWPDTMEGAVRSGQAAARELIRWLSQPPGGRTGQPPDTAQPAVPDLTAAGS